MQRRTPAFAGLAARVVLAAPGEVEAGPVRDLARPFLDGRREAGRLLGAGSCGAGAAHGRRVDRGQLAVVVCEGGAGEVRGEGARLGPAVLRQRVAGVLRVAVADYEDAHGGGERE